MWIRRLIVVVSLLVVTSLVACLNEKVEEKEIVETVEQQEQTFKVTISLFGKVTTTKEVTFEEGQNVLEVLKANFEIVEKDTFVTGIDGVIADESKQEFWSFIVNGEQAMVGSAEYEIANGDEITFDLTNW